MDGDRSATLRKIGHRLNRFAQIVVEFESGRQFYLEQRVSNLTAVFGTIAVLQIAISHAKPNTTRNLMVLLQQADAGVFARAIST